MVAAPRFNSSFKVAIIVLALAGCGGGGGGGDDSANMPGTTTDSSPPASGVSELADTAASNEECEVVVEEGSTIATNCDDFARFTPDVELGSYRGVTKPRDVAQEPSSCRVSLHPVDGMVITTYSSAAFDQITSRHEVKSISPDGTITGGWTGLANNPAMQLQMLTVMDVPDLLMGMFMLTPDMPGPASASATILSVDEQEPFELICFQLEKE